MKRVGLPPHDVLAALVGRTVDTVGFSTSGICFGLSSSDAYMEFGRRFNYRCAGGAEDLLVLGPLSAAASVCCRAIEQSLRSVALSSDASSLHLEFSNGDEVLLTDLLDEPGVTIVVDGHEYGT